MIIKKIEKDYLLLLLLIIKEPITSYNHLVIYYI